MNQDLGALLERSHREQPWPFRVFYSQEVAFCGEERALAKVGQLFSLPISNRYLGTWCEQDRSFQVDSEVALLLEADVPIRACVSSAA